MYIIFSRKTIAWTLSAVMLIAAVLFAGNAFHENTVVTVSADANWGLSFQQEGSAPIGNASAENLKNFDAYYLGDTSQKNIYLTFDAGYENGYTAKILDTLKKHQVHATFFLVGNFIETAPDLVKRMIAEGHTVGNHTMTHPDMSKIQDQASFEKEVGNLEKLYQETTGQEMLKIYRPPQGKYSENNLKMAQSMGYKTIFWSLAYVDWYNDNQPTHEEAFNKLVPRIHNGAVILLHITSKTNSEILDELLTKYEEMGYTISDISNLIK